MTARTITMPRLSDSMTEGTVVRWLKDAGAAVRRGEEIVEIETDKATMGFESEFEGFLEPLVAEGAAIAVGDPIAAVHAEAGDVVSASAAVASPSAAATIAPVPAAPTAPAPGRREPGISPVARRLAARLGVDLAALRAERPGRRILKADVRARHQQASGDDAGLATTTAELTSVQRVIAERMTAASTSVPVFHLERELIVAELVAMRARLADAASAAGERPPTINDLVLRACALALREHPHVNGSYQDGRWVFHDRVNVGLAVGAGGSLLVPTIFDADRKSVGTIAAQTRELADGARAGTLSPSQLSGASFTISNLGMFGVTRFAAIINPPQAAILAVGAAVERPVAIDHEATVAHTMSLTLTCDHRIVYGETAARFIGRVCELLSTPMSLVL